MNQSMLLGQYDPVYACARLQSGSVTPPSLVVSVGKYEPVYACTRLHSDRAKCFVFQSMVSVLSVENFTYVIYF